MVVDQTIALRKIDFRCACARRSVRTDSWLPSDANLAATRLPSGPASTPGSRPLKS